MNRSYTYLLTHKVSGHFYFGVRLANKVPAIEDLGFFYFSSSRKVKEMGFGNFKSEILKEFDDPEEAIAHEQSLIDQHRSNRLILNRCVYAGSRAGIRFINHATGKKQSQEHIRKRSKANIGKHSNNGSDRPEVKEKRRAARLGTFQSAETKRKIGNAHRGKTVSPEAIKKRLETQKSNANGSYFTDDAKRRISEARKKMGLPVTDGQTIWKNPALAGKSIGVPAKEIRRMVADPNFPDWKLYHSEVDQSS